MTPLGGYESALVRASTARVSRSLSLYTRVCPGESRKSASSQFILSHSSAIKLQPAGLGGRAFENAASTIELPKQHGATYLAGSQLAPRGKGARPLFAARSAQRETALPVV